MCLNITSPSKASIQFFFLVEKSRTGAVDAIGDPDGVGSAFLHLTSNCTARTTTTVTRAVRKSFFFHQLHHLETDAKIVNLGSRIICLGSRIARLTEIEI